MKNPFVLVREQFIRDDNNKGNRLMGVFIPPFVLLAALLCHLWISDLRFRRQEVLAGQRVAPLR